MNNAPLTDSELVALRQVGQLLCPVLDEDVERSLMDKGLIRQALGGLMRTSKGSLLLRHGRTDR